MKFDQLLTQFLNKKVTLFVGTRFIVGKIISISEEGIRVETSKETIFINLETVSIEGFGVLKHKQKRPRAKVPHPPFNLAEDRK
jgi:hypothetical protein